MSDRVIRETVLTYSVGGYDEDGEPPALALELLKQIQDALDALPAERRATARVEFAAEHDDYRATAYLTIYYDRLENAAERHERARAAADDLAKRALNEEYHERVMLARLKQKYETTNIFSHENGRP